MPKLGLVNRDGTIKKRFEEIDILEDHPTFYPATPATLAFLLDNAKGREDVGDEVTASQIEKADREIYLEATEDYYVTFDREMNSLSGSHRHAAINVEREKQVTEIRLFYDYAGKRIASARNDTYYVPTRHLYDLKHIGWYKVEKMLTGDPLIEGYGYVMQMNLFRVLMQTPAGYATIKAKYPWIQRDDLSVQKMTLEVWPKGLTLQDRRAAQRILGESRPGVILVDIPFVDDATVLNAYEEKYSKKQRYLTLKTIPPICTPEERWERNGYPLKCFEFCDVKEACQRYAGKHHPIAIADSRPKKKAS